MRKILAILAIVAFATLVLGCAEPGITEGRVIDKGYEGPYETTSYYYQCYAYSFSTFNGFSTSTCSVGAYVPITTYHDESWWLELQDCVEHPEIPLTTHIRYDECKHGRVEVSSTVYVEADIGYPYPFLEGDR